MAATKKYKVGQAVPPNKGYVLVKRDEEETIIYDILSAGGSVSIVGSRQMGKSTIAAAVQRKLAENDFRCGYIDLSIFSGSCFSGLPEDERLRDFFSKFLYECKKAFKLSISNSDFEDWFRKKAISSVSASLITSFFDEFVWSITDRACLFLDEIQAIISHGAYRDYILSAIRIMQNVAFSDKHFSVAFIGVIEPDEIFSPESSLTLNTYKTIYMNDFMPSEETIIELTAGLSDQHSEIHKQIVTKVMGFTDGQPFLTVLLLDLWNKQKGKGDFESFISEIISKMRHGEQAKTHFEQPFKHLKNYDRTVVKSINAYKSLLSCESLALDSNIATSLRLAGLIKNADNGLWKVKNPIYREILNDKWANTTMNEILSRSTAKPGSSESRGRSKKRICLINMGGTIAMRSQKDEKTGQIRVVNPEDSETFFRTYYRDIWDFAEITFQPFDPPKDGANVTPEDWSEIADIISRKKLDGFDGFVITHGTDTIAYTASALAFALGPGLNFPVVFTGAQTTHDVWYGDAHINLLRAIQVASEKKLIDGREVARVPEVVICFGDLILRACRAQKRHDQKFDGFESPSYKPLGYIMEKIEIQEDLLFKKEVNILELKKDFDPNVIELVQYPGLSPEILMKLLEEKQIRGFIIRTLGVGNLTNTGKFSLIPFIESATKNYVPVIITSQFPVEPEVALRYAPASAPLQAGAIPVGNMTPAAALTKLMWTLPQIDALIRKGDYKKEKFIELVKEKMQSNYVGEVDKIIGI